MIRKPLKFPARLAWGIGGLIFMLVMYSALSYHQHRKNPKDKTVPNYTQFVEGFQRIATPDSRGEMAIWKDIKASMFRLGVGLSVGIALSFVVGIAMGCFSWVEAFLLPTVSFFAKVPPTAMLAVYFILVGTDLESFVAMIALGIFPTLAQSIYQAAKKDVSDHAIFKAYTLGASQSEVVAEVVIRQILPRIIENVRLQVGPAMVFLFAAEWAYADVGFGYRLRMESRLTNMNIVYTYLVLMGVLGWLIDWGLSTFRRWLCPWFGE